MKYLKKFENISDTDFSVGDTVICIDNEHFEKILTIGDVYLVEKISDIHENEYKFYIENKNDDTDYFVDVINLKTNQEVTKTFASRFIPELKYNANKYNL